MSDIKEQEHDFHFAIMNFKLTSGDDIVATTILQEGMEDYQILNPLKLMMIQDPSGSTFSIFNPWFVGDPEATTVIKFKDVIGLPRVPPKKVIEAYLDKLKFLREAMAEQTVENWNGVIPTHGGTKTKH